MTEMAEKMLMDFIAEQRQVNKENREEHKKFYEIWKGNGTQGGEQRIKNLEFSVEKIEGMKEAIKLGAMQFVEELMLRYEKKFMKKIEDEMNLIAANNAPGVKFKRASKLATEIRLFLKGMWQALIALGVIIAGIYFATHKFIVQVLTDYQAFKGMLN